MTNFRSQDQQAREKALDVEKSFIVQAPAGSGKTELLIQRFLKLLTVVRNPEEIIAITFTRKAAGEMRDRIINALQSCQVKQSPADMTHKQKTLQLAYAVLCLDNKYQWNLLSNPSRLRILTIDALAVMISRQTPILSGCSGQPNITEDGNFYYEHAIQKFLDQPSLSAPWLCAVESLLLHLDNNAHQLTKLLSKLLAKRDQWLPHIISHQHDPHLLKKILEHSLQTIAIENIKTLDRLLTIEVKNELISLLQFAASQLKDNDPQHSFVAWLAQTHFPEANHDNLENWLCIVNLLLTKEQNWRKKIDKRDGFPAKSSTKNKELQIIYETNKQRWQCLVNRLQDDKNLLTAMQNLLICPPIYYHDSQWKIIQALLQLLPYCVAQLLLIFKQHNTIDFVELTLAALRALGEEDHPTDLALYLDYQIHHLLVDEFQDTSIIQFKLIETLIRGWYQGDGHSLFLVGDPMQSIYRFRNAEVSLFMQAQQHGVADIHLESLQLKLNFRSNAKLVDWVNESFNQILPSQADTESGAIPYSPSQATKASDETAVLYHVLSTDHDEAQICQSLVKKYLTDSPTSTIAILVRSRHHLLHITPALQEAGIPYQAIEIETLAHLSEIQDLLALTQALTHLEHRIAWLSLLRAPWCGLPLNDLEAICHHSIKDQPDKKTIWSQILDYHNITDLSPTGRKLLDRVVPVLQNAFACQGQRSLANWIEGIWLGLGGPATYQQSVQLTNAQTFFQLISTIEADFDMEKLTEKTQKLFSTPNNSQHSRLQLMTIHKSKGLQFDHVIIPSLHRQITPAENELLMWLERPNQQGLADLIFAPIKSAAQKEDRIYHYVKMVENHKRQRETARLFYVAATRSKTTLDLLMQVNYDVDKNKFTAPHKSSFLALLWPHEAKTICQLNQDHPLNSSATINKQPDSKVSLHRLAENWIPPFTITHELNTAPVHHKLSDIASLNHPQRHFGTLLHHVLQQIALHGIDIWRQQAAQQNFAAYWHHRLQHIGISHTDLPYYHDKLMRAIENALTDPRAIWILSPHQEAYSEYAISAVLDDELCHLVIDRTFIDTKQQCWIIDFKTSEPKPEQTVTEFLQAQLTAHQQQMLRYKQAMALRQQHPISLGLYFPVDNYWVEYDKNQLHSQSTACIT